MDEWNQNKNSSIFTPKTHLGKDIYKIVPMPSEADELKVILHVRLCSIVFIFI